MRKFPHHEQKEFAVFQKLSSPSDIQNFINRIPINFETKKETCRSPLLVLQHHEAHCMEGALLAAAILWYHHKQPLLLDLKAAHNDYDHVVTLFRHNNQWGAVSKTNHAALRYRDPVYKTIRELAMSYFHEYFTDNGVKTLRSYSAPYSVLRYGTDWLTTEKDLWHIAAELDDSPHTAIIGTATAHSLRKADMLERKAGKLVEWKKK
ncbi:MAG: hypothetical protein AAB581_01130 [Patescibacteria group bacterium]